MKNIIETFQKIGIGFGILIIIILVIATIITWLPILTK